MCQRLTSPPRGPFLLGARAPAQDAKHLWFSVRRRWSSLPHPSTAALAPFFKVKVTSPRSRRQEPHPPAPSHISVTSTLAAHRFSSKPVLTSRMHSVLQPPGGVPTARAAPPAVPRQLPFLCYLPGPILGSASPPVKLTFPLPSTLHVCSMILVSCPHTVLGAKKAQNQ